MGISAIEDTEDELGFLLRDLRTQADAAILEYDSAIWQKLFSIKFNFNSCMKSIGTLETVAAEEKKGEEVLLVRTTYYIQEAPLYLESFLYFLTSLFDILAKITLYFYPTHRAAVPKHYFLRQIRFFTETEPALDARYRGVLENNRKWIETVFENRNAFAHNFAPFFAFQNDGSVMFEHRKPENADLTRKKQFQSTRDYLMNTLTSLYAFLDEFVKVHRDKVAESDITRVIRKAKEDGRVKRVSWSPTS